MYARPVMVSVERARSLAEGHLAGTLPRRWTHVRAVGTKSAAIAPQLFDELDSAVLVASAWLHDIGYAPELVETGFHPLDGARWLRRQGFDERVTALVAHHSCARLEAAERDLRADLENEFGLEESPVSDALWYADMTTGPDGQDFEVTDRLAEVRSRYGPDDVVTRFIVRAGPDLVAAVRRTEERLRATAGVQPT